MDFKHYKCQENDSGRTLEKIIRKMLPDTSLSKIYQSIRNGLIRINGKKARQSDKLVSGDEIWIADFFSVKTAQITDKPDEYNISLENVFENEHIRIINKPSGYSVQGSKSKKPNLSDIIKADFSKKNFSSLAFTPGPLHRLDTFTTGLLVFSNSITGAQDFSEALKNNQIKKTYLAVLEGKLTRKLELNDYIEKEKNNNSKFHTMKISSENLNGKNAVTLVKPVFCVNDQGEKTFVEIQIETGRKHQIRLQCANAGFPLAGDDVYGAKTKQHMMLHCYKMQFEFDNKIALPQELTAPLREDFLIWAKKFLPNSILLNYNICNEILK